MALENLFSFFFKVANTKSQNVHLEAKSTFVLSSVLFQAVCQRVPILTLGLCLNWLLGLPLYFSFSDLIHDLLDLFFDLDLCLSKLINKRTFILTFPRLGGVIKVFKQQTANRSSLFVVGSQADLAEMWVLHDICYEGVI